ncbi:type II toxin-antitoxin system RelE/ParE family toxin [Longimicrobium sp.]|uniref:type II toxin-antitoxin system RelE/ParE family toxin n=1 Tax=Longimicrobium sp. TaxID=2029185 RepID=UPI002C8BAEE6|nr:type II toxin-antitoxin system RelE/ParE family toxin [Longimicrobium sp.]HSU12951.1 type II toxin-antitoxin system RelE/ParE family toxin [Longimicrobium sp.]
MYSTGARAHFLEFVFLPSFERTAQGVLSPEDIRELELTLLQQPRAGAVLRDTGGVRKVRAAIEGRGKSGSARVVYLYVEVRQKIYLLLCFAKNEQGNLTPEQKRRVRELVAQLQAEEAAWPAATAAARSATR